ncbi:MAG TPA: glycoside hydrolase family 3 N-terminal domain-containing protein [Meiothermus sp.]|nr:glycoside hydrolase family 3 N-terminal domain-containing protein [Meiothermus sp.]
MDPAQAGKFMIVDVPGPVLQDEDRAHLARYQFAGVCLFRKNVQTREQLSRLVTDIREVLGPEALICLDQEGGMVTRVLEIPQAPAPMAIGAVGSAELAREVGAAVARGLGALGINWNLAPPLDVNTNPANPIIGERSFGSHPVKVTELGLAWAAGLEGAGVMGSVKHFPGHGDTAQDSHLTLPTVDKPLMELEKVELYPFFKAVEQGIGSVMTAHVVFPALDPDYPATLSRPILTGLLRQGWGYEGLIVTDAFDMKAIAARFPLAEATVQTVLAGADLICALGPKEVQTAQVQALRGAVVDGRISSRRLEETCSRLEAATHNFPATSRPYPAEQEAADEALMQSAARQSITAIGEVRLPRPSDQILLLAPQSARVGAVYEEESTAERLLRYLRAEFPRLSLLTYPPAARSVQTRVIQEAHAADFILMATTSRTELHPEEVELARTIFGLGKPALHLGLWNPYHARTLGYPALLTYGFRDPSLIALSEVLAGGQATGRLPVQF